MKDFAAMCAHVATLSWLMLRFIARYAYVIFRARVLELPVPGPALAALNEKTAREYVRAAMVLKGGTIKVGQFLSARADVLPRELIDILSELQDRVTPAPFAEVALVLRAEYGREPDAVFASIEHNALAAASFGQVHRAVTHQGERVVVKVLHRQIKRSLAVDLAIFRVAVFFFSRLFPRFSLDVIYDGIAEATLHELDYAREADSAERVRKGLALDPRVRVPRVIREYCRPRVLCLEDVTGDRLDDPAHLVAIGLSPREVLKAIVGAYCQQIYVEGFFQSDPHPGNLFCYRPGTAGEAIIGIIDFGQAKEMSPAIHTALRKGVLAVIRRDADMFLEAMVEMGVIESADTGVVRVVVERLGAQLHTGAVSEVMNIDFEALSRDVLRALRDLEALTLPADLMLYGRTLSLLNGLAFRLDPDMPVFEIAAPYLLKFVRP